MYTLTLRISIFIKSDVTRSKVFVCLRFFVIPAVDVKDNMLGTKIHKEHDTV